MTNFAIVVFISSTVLLFYGDSPAERCIAWGVFYGAIAELMWRIGRMLTG